MQRLDHETIRTGSRKADYAEGDGHPRMVHQSSHAGKYHGDLFSIHYKQYFLTNIPINPIPRGSRLHSPWHIQFDKSNKNVESLNSL